MADAVDKSPDDGKVGLPRTDSAMNKIAPIDKIGGKGGKDDPQRLQIRERRKAEQKLLQRALKRFDRCTKAESENRKQALDDLKFKVGEQWPADIAAQRNTDKRPCLTINKIPTFVHQVTNDLRQNRPGIVVSPVGDRGDPEVAKMYRGLIRAIERDSAADIAYDTGADQAVSTGFGFWRINTEYDQPDSFDQVIVVKRIRNQFTVYLDPDSQEPEGADAKFAFITEMMPRSEFEETYPDADPCQFDKAAVGDALKAWIDQDSVRVAEYYEIKTELRRLVKLSNQHEGWHDELAPEILDQIESGALEILNDREAEQRTITWYKLTAKEVLDETEWLGQWIPIVRMIGDEVDIEGKVKLAGVIRNAKDPQRMYNYWRTAETELIALAPKAPFIGAEGQFEGHEDKWNTANTRNYPYLEYRPVDLNGKPSPPPARQAFAGAPQGVEQAAANAAQDMMATTGIRFDATKNERMIDESGKAIKELRRSGDLGSFHYADNMARSLRHTGKMIVDLIPKIYSDKRIVTILREDDTEEQVEIDPHAQRPYQEQRLPPSNENPKGKVRRIFNPTYGHYGVTVTIGPSYATKRIEAAENMINFAKTIPSIAPIVADLIAKELDFEGAEEIAKRIAKSLPPQLLTPDAKDIPPQVQAMLQALQTQIQHLAQERQQLIAALTEKMTDRQQRQDEIDKSYDAKLRQIEEKFIEALVKIEGKVGENSQKVHGDLLKTFMTSMLSAKGEEVDGDGKPKKKEDPNRPLIEAVTNSHKQLIGKLDDTIKAVTRPRKAKLRRADGSMLEVTSE